MQQRVTAILVARSGADYLERTLAALDRQTRSPDLVIAVDAGSTDRSGELLTASGAAQLLAAPGKATFGQAVSLAMHPPARAESDNEWLWLLAHDNAPHPSALAELLGAVEVAPSVAVAGPKLMRWEQSDVIAEFGESMTALGTSVRLVEGELDQAQHDVENDVLAVAASGMLVRRSVWEALGGFDPGLPSTDAALDFSVRVRLAGHRVVVVPNARVASAGGPQHFGRPSLSEARRARIARSAQLHRRLTYSAAVALPLHWLSLVPLAFIRSIVHLLAKRPGSVGAEFASAISTALNVTPVARARRTFQRTRRLGWGAIAPLRLTWRQAREHRAHRAEVDFRPDAAVAYVDEPVGFISGGGLWVVLAAGIVGLIAFGGVIGAPSIVGGGLLPLSAEVGSLWAQVGYGMRDIGASFIGAADPFSYVLAILGSLTFWQPSLSIVVLYLVALPLATLGAWFCARRMTTNPWLPALAAVLWGIAPPFLASLHTGHLGASIAHVLLPWLVLLAVNGARSWTSAAGAALLFAVVAASAPVLIPALLVLLLARVVAQPRNAHRLLGIPLPAAALFAPLVIDQFARDNPLALLADPGVPFGGGTSSGIQLVLGSASGGSNGWSDMLQRVLLPGTVGPFVVAALLLPLGVLALLALFLRGSRRAIPALFLSLLGYATAVLASRIEVSYVSVDTVAIWPGSGLSLFWLGLLGGAVIALDGFGGAASGSAVLLGVASVLVSVPLIAAGLLGTTTVRPGLDRILPAFVDAEARSQPGLGTLVLTPEGEDALSATIERGRGVVLDDQSTLHSTARTLSEADDRLANLAGNLASRSGYASAQDLDELALGFVVLENPRGDGAESVFTRTQEALDGNALFVSVGETSDVLLWRYAGTAEGQTEPPALPGNTDSVYGVAVLTGQGLIVGLTILLAIPTSRSRPRHAPDGVRSDEPAAALDGRTDD